MLFAKLRYPQSVSSVLMTLTDVLIQQCSRPFASVAAQSITAPDQANWGTIISVKFDGIPAPNADLLLVGVNKKKTYLIAYQAQIYSGDINLVLPYVVEQGVKYQIVATNLNGGFGNPLTYALSNAFTIN